MMIDFIFAKRNLFLVVLTISCCSEVQNLVEFFFIVFYATSMQNRPTVRFCLVFYCISPCSQNGKILSSQFWAFASTIVANRRIDNFLKTGCKFCGFCRPRFPAFTNFCDRDTVKKIPANPYFACFTMLTMHFKNFIFSVTRKRYYLCASLMCALCLVREYLFLLRSRFLWNFNFQILLRVAYLLLYKQKKSSPKKGADFNSQSKVICRILCWRPVGEI